MPSSTRWGGKAVGKASPAGTAEDRSGLPEEARDLELAGVLVRMSHVVQAVFADVSRSCGLTPQQVQLLGLLTAGPLGMSELRRLLHLEKSSLTGLVDRAERRGLVARAPDPEDGRACRIELTPAGVEAAVTAHHKVLTGVAGLLGGLSPSDRDLMTGLARQVIAAHRGPDECSA